MVTYREKAEKNRIDLVESYLKDASGELKELEDRIEKCDNTDIVSLSSDFKQSIVGAGSVLYAIKLPDTETIRLRGEIQELEYRFNDLVNDFEVNCVCSKRKR